MINTVGGEPIDTRPRRHPAPARGVRPPSICASGAWSIDYQLPPGIGARLTTSSGFTNFFTGVVLNHDGSIFADDFIFPALFAGPEGIYRLVDKCPVVSYSSEMFTNIDHDFALAVNIIGKHRTRLGWRSGFG